MKGSESMQPNHIRASIESQSYQQLELLACVTFAAMRHLRIIKSRPNTMRDSQKFNTSIVVRESVASSLLYRNGGDFNAYQPRRFFGDLAGAF
jgi:hypothetical protein